MDWNMHPSYFTDEDVIYRRRGELDANRRRSMTDDDEDEAHSFGTDVISIRTTLELLEAKLLETGLDEITISTQRGTWTWKPRPN
jgi:hypothetical protein